MSPAHGQPMSRDAQALRQQQQALAAAVQGAVAPAGLLQPTPQGGSARLDVYQQAYSARLVGALRDNVEVLARALGDEAFDALARAYLAAHPSTEPSIRWFGHRLATFMDQCNAAGDGLVPHPALADLARLEWALRAAFDAADGPVIGRTALAALPPEAWPGLRLQLHSSVALLPLQWAVGPAWQRLRAAAPGDDPTLPAPEPLAHTVLVWRRGLDTQWRSLDPLEAGLLQAAAAGQPFAALCEVAAEVAAGPVAEAPQALPRVVAALQQWLDDGLVSAQRG